MPPNHDWADDGAGYYRCLRPGCGAYVFGANPAPPCTGMQEPEPDEDEEGDDAA